MSKIKNKDTLYAIVRNDLTTLTDVVCAFARTLEGAEELCGEYQQAFEDAGGDKEVMYFYVVGNTFYDK